MNKNQDDLLRINELVDRIDKLRVEHNYSIYELALKSDVSINTIKYIYKKKGYPNIRTLYNICEAFEIPIWFLFFKDNTDLYLSKTEYELVTNFKNLSPTSKRLVLEISKNMK